MDRTREHAHGRIEVRTLKVAAVAGLCLPHAAQAIQVTRRVARWAAAGAPCTPSSLALGTASPAQLACWLRGLEDREPAALGPRRELQRRRLLRAPAAFPA